MSKLDYSGAEVPIITSMASFLRAIYLSDPKIKIGSIQKSLNFLQIIPSLVDFKNKKDVMKEIITIARVYSEKQRMFKRGRTEEDLK